MRAVAAPLLLAVGALVAGCDSGEDREPAPEPVGTPVTITVNADRPLTTVGSMNGFLHSLSEDEPADELVRPLAPRLWRSDLARAPVGRARSFGARYQLVLSDLWGYPANDWNGRGPPWADFAGWEAFVRRVARDHADERLSWDIWNEPDGPTFWSGGRRRFFETYALANRVLREELGEEAQIVGPSVSRWSPKFIDAFLGHCLAEGCRISALSWHENPRPQDRISDISEHLIEARERVLANPRYAPLGIEEIHVNEYTGRTDRYLPGEAVAYLAELQEGGADLAAISCWSETDCSPAGLSGLLSPASGSPRAVWWAHRWYAQGADAPVRSSSSDPRVAVLASVPGDGRVEVLLGHTGQRPVSGPGEPVAIKVELEGKGRADRYMATIDRLSASGGRAAQPRRLEERAVDATDGTVELELPALGVHEAALLRLRPTVLTRGAG